MKFNRIKENLKNYEDLTKFLKFLKNFLKNLKNFCEQFK